MNLSVKLKKQAIEIFDALNAIHPKDQHTFLLNYDSGNVENSTFVDKKTIGYQFSVLTKVEYNKDEDTHEIFFSSPVKKG